MTHLRVFSFVISCFFIVIQSCNKQPIKQEAVVIASVEQAKQAIIQQQGKAADFVLPISQDRDLTLHGADVSREAAMAIITDCILEKGWMPDSFEDKGRVRYYKYSQ